CRFGTVACVNGAPACVGNIDPQTETCNGRDDDCDGVIDSHNGQPPADSVGPCQVPPAPPPGMTSPCHAGTLACIGGTVQCVGAAGPTSPTDKCGEDSNCDGVAGPQPDLMTDVHNCGTCGHDCLVGAVHANWSCQAGQCHFDGCQPNFWDL